MGIQQSNELMIMWEQLSLPLALCWIKYWPLKNLHVELSPLQTPQASNTALEPSP